MLHTVIGIAMLTLFVICLVGGCRAWQGDRYTKITHVALLIYLLSWGLGELVCPTLVRDWLWLVMGAYLAVCIFCRYRSVRQSN